MPTLPTRLLPVLPLLFPAAGCTQDPNLFGYWEVTRWTVGSGSTAEVVEDAGTIEFTANGFAWLVFSYRYESGRGMVPDPTPDIVDLQVTLVHQNEDEEQFFPAYQSDGERYFLELYGHYEVLDWTGGGMTLSSKAAAPYGTWDEVVLDASGFYVPTASLPVEMEMIR